MSNGTLLELPQRRYSSDPVDALERILRNRQMTPVDLGRMLGDPTLGEQILNRERPLTQSHIKRLSERFRVAPAIFLSLAD